MHDHKTWEEMIRAMMDAMDIQKSGYRYCTTTGNVDCTPIHADGPRQDPAPTIEIEPSDISISSADIDLELYDAFGYVPKVRGE